MSTPLPLGRPDIRQSDIDQVVEVLRSGWITTGQVAAEFERSFADRVGAAGAVALCSGTAGMHAVLASLDLQPGDEIITQSLTWVSTANVATRLGARVIFVDVDRETLLLHPQDVEPLLSPRTKAIIPVHFAGAPADLNPLREIASRHNVSLIEDAAHAAGTAYAEKPIGAGGTCVFSFHPLKNLTTGEGGMVCSDDPDLLAQVRRFKFHGLGHDAYDRETQRRTAMAEVIEPGLKFNLPDMNAALGLAALPRLDDNNHARELLAERYLERLSEIPGIYPLGRPDYSHQHAWSLFAIRIDDDIHGMTRSAFMDLLKNEGIGTGVHFYPVHMHQWYRRHYADVSLPNTEWNGERLCSLPLYPTMSIADVDRVADVISHVVAGTVA